MKMEKVQRVFAFLGLIWVINILFHLISPGAFMAWYAHCDNLVLQMGGSINGRAAMIWRLAWGIVSASVILLAGLRVQSVIARVVKSCRLY